MDEVLTEQGYSVIRAATPEQALAVLRGASTAFDLILSDPFAPSADPYRWLSHVRQAAPAPTPIVICSAPAASAYADHRHQGFAAYVAKPFDLDDLLQLVATLSGPTPTRAPAPVMAAPAPR